ncbi:MAG: hypothetical protein WAV23_03115 [Minisyncoccia bacterium]
MINDRAKYTANTGMGIISVANPNRTGAGTIVSIITGAGSGTLVKSITIKATGNTTHGTVRLYCYYNASWIILLKEIDVRAVTQSAIDQSFSATLKLNFLLGAGYIIKASTENAESFIVTAEGLDWAY